ncbi:MAG: methyltransferase domain-containing protein [Bacteroidales bacterium]|nr:methyltransferase domain-containing protein [Bacteroidales bacterium]
MDNTDFALFYDMQPDYAAFRNDPGRREDYNITVDWKARKLIQLIPDDFVVNNILEVGCAFGVLLNNLADRLHLKTRIGIDISGKNIKVARNLYPDCYFFQGTLDEFIRVNPVEIKDHRFDLIVLSDIIEHIPDDLGFLEMVKKSSSYVLLNLPLEKSFRTRNRQYGEQDSSGHLRCYDKDLAIRLVTMAGFEVVTSFTSIASSDKRFYEIYKKNRTSRVRSKPLHLRLFWSLFYFVEDKMKLINRRFSEKIYGTNYFALLRSINL